MSLVGIASPLAERPTTLVAPPDLEVIEVEGPYQRVVDNTTGQHSLQAIQSFKAGEIMATFRASTVHELPNMYTIQLNETLHVELNPKILQFANHSCKPNTFFNTSTGEVEVLTDIASGEMITWFYPCSELRMSCPFQCTCGAKECLGMISGAADISKEIIAKYKMNKHITNLLKKQEQS